MLGQRWVVLRCPNTQEIQLVRRGCTGAARTLRANHGNAAPPPVRALHSDVCVSSMRRARSRICLHSVSRTLSSSCALQLSSIVPTLLKLAQLTRFFQTDHCRLNYTAPHTSSALCAWVRDVGKDQSQEPYESLCCAFRYRLTSASQIQGCWICDTCNRRSTYVPDRARCLRCSKPRGAGLTLHGRRRLNRGRYAMETNLARVRAYLLGHLTLIESDGCEDRIVL
jgi:hypothetical protein